MNKTELVNAIAAKEGIEKKCAEKAVNAVVAANSAHNVKDPAQASILVDNYDAVPNKDVKEILGL